MDIDTIDPQAGAPVDTGTSAVAEAQATGADPAPAQTPAAQAEAAGEKPSISQIFKRNAEQAERARDATGKFAPKAGDKPAAAAPAAGDPTSLNPAKPENPGQAAPAQPLQAPARWGAEAKALYASLPPTVQTEIARVEAESRAAVTKAQQESADTKKNYADLEQGFKVHQARLTLRGESPQQAARRLLDLEATFEQNPALVLQHLAKQAGINLATLGAQPQPGANRQDLDPALQPLFEQVETLAAREQQREAEAVQQRQTQAGNDMNAFKDAKDAQGNPLYPHYGTLETDPSFVQRVRSMRLAQPNRSGVDILKEAYEQEVWSNPATRALMLEHQRVQADKEREKTAQQESQRARAAAATVRGTAAAAPGKPSIKDIFQKNAADAGMQL